MQQNFIMSLFFFPYHPKSNVAASPHKSKKNCKYQCQLKGIHCHLRPWVTMGFSYIWLDLLSGYSRQGIERLRSSIYYNFLLPPIKVAGDQAHRSRGKPTGWSLAYMPTLLD